MPLITIVFGCLLIAVGAVGYLESDPHAPTASIPAYIGLALALLGLMAFKDGLRKHVMHLAVLVGLAGFVGPTIMRIRALVNGAVSKPLAEYSQWITAGLCLVFVALCVNSFIQARRRRAQAAAPPS